MSGPIDKPDVRNESLTYWEEVLKSHSLELLDTGERFELANVGVDPETEDLVISCIGDAENVNDEEFVDEQ